MNQKHTFDMEYERHQRRLQNIKTNANAAYRDPVYNDMRKVVELRANNFKYQKEAREAELDRDNNLLLGRLVEITRQKQTKLYNSKSSSALSKPTLHAPHRKMEIERIHMENEALAKRLLTQSSEFNAKRLEKDYEKHVKNVKHVMKLPFSPKGSKAKLPPIESKTTTNATTKKIEFSNGNGSKSNDDKEPKEGEVPETKENNNNENQKSKGKDTDRKNIEKKDTTVKQDGKNQNTDRDDKKDEPAEEIAEDMPN